MLLNVSFDDTFVPAFLNLSAVTPEIRAICGDNRECYFDVMQTGNEEIGEETKGFEEDTQAAIAELGNYCRKKKVAVLYTRFRQFQTKFRHWRACVLIDS